MYYESRRRRRAAPETIRKASSTTPTATEAARSFSNVLNRVADGEAIEVTRSGAPVAVISPPRGKLISAVRFRELIAAAPSLDSGSIEDVEAIREAVAAPKDPWAS